MLALLLAAAIAVTPETVVWKDGPPNLPAGSQIAVLEGDPKLPGIFTMRVRVPAGAQLAPHWHPRDERVTILSGSVELGFGTTADKGAVKRYGAGSFYVNPPRTMHYLYFPEDTVMQMTGLGPWKIETSDPAQQNPPVTATLTLREISPKGGEPVSASTQIAATVDYAIQDFRPGAYYFGVQFESTTPGRTFSVDRMVTRAEAAASAPPVSTLESATGSAHVTYDLSKVWTNANLRRPVRLKIALHELTSETTSRIVASTDWVEYR